ncbi:MAG: UDP-3-O-acyl-N-acetylglucosamine deacetylase [Pseudomonadota bacterium]
MGAGRQKTLKAPIEFSGVGLHTGDHCRMILRPSAENSGITFFRCNAVNGAESTEYASLSERNAITAAPENVVRACHGTTLANSHGVSIATVEHIMAALAICSIDNVAIDVVGPEIPILDGSAAQFVIEIHSVGVVSQGAPRDEIIIDSKICVRDGDRSIVLEPSETFQLNITIDFEDCLIGRQTLSVELDDPESLERMARSRTFCRLHEVEALRAKNLIRGGSLENSIVVDGQKVLNEDALRDSHEFVLHKALDLIGDLYLLGAPVRGAIRADKPGHDLNTRAALAVFEAQVGDAPAQMAATA